MYAIVRDLPSSFANCVTSVDNNEDPINMELARKQHDDYVDVIKQHVKHVIQVPADEAHPDCCFVEDNAIVVGDKAIINHLGAESRRKEVSGIENALKEIPVIKNIVRMHEIDPEATLDGGDVLYTGKHLLVGLSHLHVIKSLLTHDSLHFKCILSMLNDTTLLITDHEAGQQVMDEIKSFTGDHYTFIKVPEQVPSNILSLDGGKFIIYQKDFPESEKVITEELKNRRGVEVKALCMSELIKADGALTCCSILI
ncbi:hypothetical protein BDF21DRAFT_435630 [Thamnidium elegans]|nr:hypothetical protein BDF21DRAFT_435630 [Thamnidium elegans]